MNYIAHVALPEYLEQYCLKHGGTFTAHDDEVCINIGFYYIAESRLRNNLFPYASLDVARSKGMIPEVGSINSGDGKRKWVRIGTKELYKKKGNSICETKDMVYVLTKQGRESVIEALDSIFVHFFIVGWLKLVEEYKSLMVMPERKTYIDSFLGENGIALEDTNYEALKKRCYRILGRCNSVIPINSEK